MLHLALLACAGLLVATQDVESSGPKESAKAPLRLALDAHTWVTLAPKNFAVLAVELGGTRLEVEQGRGRSYRLGGYPASVTGEPSGPSGGRLTLELELTGNSEKLAVTEVLSAIELSGSRGFSRRVEVPSLDG